MSNSSFLKADAVDTTSATCGGEIIGLHQYLGKREYPLTGGVTSLHLCGPVDSKLKNWTISILEKMHWDGPAMVEYRV